MARQTPREALYALFRGELGLGHHALSQLILSDRPYRSGLSPRQMSADSSWLSRSVVHAPMGPTQEQLFDDPATSARHVHAHLSRRGIGDAEIVRTVCGSPLMADALSASGRQGLAYANALRRLELLDVDDAVRARAALTLAIAAGCTGDLTLAIGLAQARIRADGRTPGRVTPVTTALPEAAPDRPSADTPPRCDSARQGL